MLQLLQLVRQASSPDVVKPISSMAPWMSRLDRHRREKALQASLAARWMWALFKGFVLVELLLYDGDLRSSIVRPSVEGLVGVLCYAGVYGGATVMYIMLSRSDPGWVPLNADRGDDVPESVVLNVGSPSHIQGEDVASGCGSGSGRRGGVDTCSGRKGEGAGAGKGRRNSDGNHPAGYHPSDTIQVRAAGSEGGVVARQEQEQSRQQQRGSGEGGEDGAMLLPVAEMSREDSSLHCGYCDIDVITRTKHCRDCGRCCHTFDHHCFWIGTCVGEYNHRLFWWYLLLETLTCGWSCSLSGSTFTTVTNEEQWMRDWISSNMLPMAALGISLVFLVMVGGLLCFHTYLLCTGQTTYEVAKRDRISYLKDVPSQVYPFSVGCLGNVREVCGRGGLPCCGAPGRAPPVRWPLPSPPWRESQKFWWIENEYWSCF